MKYTRRFEPYLFYHWQGMFDYDNSLGKISFPIFTILILKYYKCDIKFYTNSQKIVPDNFDLTEMLPIFRAYNSMGVFKKWKINKKAKKRFNKYKETNQTITANDYIKGK